MLSYFAGFGCLFLTIPPLLIGAIATQTSKSNTCIKLYFFEYHADIQITRLVLKSEYKQNILQKTMLRYT